MSKTCEDFGENSLGPCVTSGDVISRAILRFESAGRSGVRAMLGLAGFKNEQAVGRWGRKIGVRGGESPKWSWLIENVGAWPPEMQEDVLRSLSRAMGRTVTVGLPGSPAGVKSSDVMPETLGVLNQATKLVEMTHRFQADGKWTPGEASEYVFECDKLGSIGNAAKQKVIDAVVAI